MNSIHSDSPEDNDQKQINRLISDNPGISYKQLFQEIEILPSTLAWHLDVLETEHFIIKQRIGPCLHYYPLTYINKNNQKMDLSLLECKTTLYFLEFIANHPGITLKQLTKRFSLKKEELHENLENLRKANLIDLKPEKKQILYYIKHICPKM